MDKAALHRELVSTLERELQTLVAAQRLSSEGVTHADAKADGIKDMRATEASYIARGQALRVSALREDLDRVAAMKPRSFAAEDAIALSAVVTLVDGEEHETRVFLAPAGGGTTLGELRVITPASPLGRALLGKRVEDITEVVRGGATSELEIVAVE